MNGDWLKLHRKALDSQVFSDPILWHLFCWCLLKANWKPSWFMGIEVKAGSFATGRNSASAELEMLPSTWYKRIKKLESFGLISVSGNNRFTIITVKKWGLYQTTDDSGNNQVTTKGQPSNNQVTTKGQPSSTIEEGKEREEGKEVRERERGVQIPELLSNSDFVETWKLYLRWAHARDGRPLDDITATLRLKTLHERESTRRGKAVEDLKLTMERAEKTGTIWDSDRQQTTTNGKPPKKKLRVTNRDIGRI